MKIIYKKLRDNTVLPYAATQMSGGLDVTAAHIEHVSENEVVIYLGFSMQPVQKSTGMHVNGGKHSRDHLINYRIRFSPRSSFTKYNWILQNSPCLGDADFTGEYRLRFRAIPTRITKIPLPPNKKAIGITPLLKYEPFPYKVGDRVAQLWVEEIIPIEFEEGELPNLTDRKGGFGSTDK